MEEYFFNLKIRFVSLLEEKPYSMKLTEQQQHVLDKIKDFMGSDASVFILRGYAGTGKTTMVKQIADYISSICKVVLMAPTGRAARILQVKTGHPANTIHKSIYSGVSLITKHDEDIKDSEFSFVFPITTVDDRVVAIVDEASMISSKKVEHEILRFGSGILMDDLLTYIRPSFGGKIIFVGDPAQLPPVGDNISNALSSDFFEKKDLKVMGAELTEILRQSSDSAILKNSIQLRNLLNSQIRNSLAFEEKPGEVEGLEREFFLNKYFDERKESGNDNLMVVCYTNQMAADYNKEIRKEKYGQADYPLTAGDTLLIVQNNYNLDLMNGDIVKVVSVGGNIKQAATIKVDIRGKKEDRKFEMEFVKVKVANSLGEERESMLLLNLLNNGEANLSLEEQRALFVNFRMRHPGLKPGSEEFATALKDDPYFNSLKAKYGYAITGHKCQGGEWDKVFVDYLGRTGMSDACLRWAYTATTRARECLYFTNLPHISPFTKFRFEPIQQCKSVSEEFRVIGKYEYSPFHKDSDPDYLHAKWMCINANMAQTIYSINKVVSKPYQEMYYIMTPDGVVRYDIRYKKGGLFFPAVSQKNDIHTEIIKNLLDNERDMPLLFNYRPSDELYFRLYSLIRSACDSLDIQMLNVVEHKEDYNVMYYFRTSNSVSYIKIYIDSLGYVSYAKPMSVKGEEDNEFSLLVEEIKNHLI